MSKTEQVRIPTDLADKARLVAAAMKKSLPRYVEDILRQAVMRDLPKAAKIVNKVASEADKPLPPSED